jgi:predicted negative regulator of RcsB-dependent stress response
MAYNLEEQEQIDALKAWWNKWGNLLLTVVTTVMLAIVAFRAWGWYQTNEASKAAAVYEAFKEHVTKKDLVKAKETSGQLFEKHSATAYGQMAALQMAKLYVDEKDPKSAKTVLEWASTKAKDVEFQHSARLRLAGILLDEKAYEEGLKLLSATPDEHYLALYADRRGDLLFASGKPAEAKTAYKQALDKLEDRSPLKETVKLKYDALGGDAS